MGCLGALQAGVCQQGWPLAALPCAGCAHCTLTQGCLRGCRCRVRLVPVPVLLPAAALRAVR